MTTCCLHPVPTCTLCLLLAMCLHTGLTQECNDGYELASVHHASRYKLSPLKLSWDEASIACQSDGEGTHLAVINSNKEAEAVKEFMAKIAGTGSTFAWVGITDVAEEGVWLTVEGELLSESGYASWAANQPDATLVSNCGLVDTKALYWDNPCSSEWNFLCEKPNK